ncbi:MAG TPA: hypothetical protein VHE79_11510 [Spirochaetia bacterium]
MVDSNLYGYSSSYLNLAPSSAQCAPPTTQSAALKPPPPPAPAAPPANVIQLLRVECSDATRFAQIARGGVAGSAKLQIVATEGATTGKVAFGTDGAEIAVGDYSAGVSLEDKSISVGKGDASLSVGARDKEAENWKAPEKPEEPKSDADKAKEEAEKKRVVTGAMLSGSLSLGGTDTLTVKVSSTLPGGRKQFCVRTESGAPGDAGPWVTIPTVFTGNQQQATHKITVPPKRVLSPKRAAPETYYVWGRCEGTEALCVVVESYPTTQLELEIEVSFLGKLVEAINEEIKLVIKEVMEKATSAVKIAPVIEGPKGSLSIKGGWKEKAGSPRVGFELEAAASLCPLWKFGVESSLSLLALAEEGGLAFVGIVAPVSTAISDATKYCADLRLSLTVTEAISEKWSGAVTFNTDGSKDGSLSFGCTTEGSIKVGIAASIGNDCFLGASLEGTVETGIRCEGKTEATPSGIDMGLKVIWPAITATVTLKFRAGSIEGGPTSGPMKPFEEVTLFEGGPWHLMKF